MSGPRWKWIFALLWFLPGVGLRAQQAPVALRDEAVVQGETIRLADLLPLEVNAATRLAAAKINLGRAPQPGSVRVFSEDKLRSAVAGQIAVTFPATTVVRGVGWPLREASIRQTLRESEAGRHYDFAQARLVPPADFSTRTPDPRLEVLAIRSQADEPKLSASLRCGQRSDCGSFLVEIVFDEPVPVGIGRPARLRTEKPDVAQAAPANPAPAPALVQPGRAAKMLFEGEGFKITTRVLPLQRAGMGQVIRVFDPMARQVSLARVEGKDLMSFREAR